jgi:hypothetical protein
MHSRRCEPRNLTNRLQVMRLYLIERRSIRELFAQFKIGPRQLYKLPPAFDGPNSLASDGLSFIWVARRTNFPSSETNVFAAGALAQNLLSQLLAGFGRGKVSASIVCMTVRSLWKQSREPGIIGRLARAFVFPVSVLVLVLRPRPRAFSLFSHRGRRTRASTLTGHLQGAEGLPASILYDTYCMMLWISPVTARVWVIVNNLFNFDFSPLLLFPLCQRRRFPIMISSYGF